jgi:hypothetical protein
MLRWKLIVLGKQKNVKISAKESISYYELKNHKPWFERGCPELLDKRKQANLQWLQDPTERNGDILNNVRCEASRHFGNKKREYLQGRIKELATNSENKNVRDLYRGINEFKRVYQPRSNLVKDENVDLLTDSINTVNRWKSCFSQLLDNVSDIRQTDIHTAEPTVTSTEILRMKLLLQNCKSINLLTVIKFWQN